MRPYYNRMAIPTVKSTYSLDLETVRTLEELARHWGVSKSEALRRAIRAAAYEWRHEENDALKALDELQQSLSLSSEKARAWANQVRSERKATSARREPRGG
jgi:hypothetical protein